MPHALVLAVVALRLQKIPLLAPPAASRAAAAPALRLVELDESNFAAEVGAVPGLAVVEFYAPWCRTCRSAAPIFAREVRRMGAEARYERVRFFKVNFKENPRLAMRERVFALPAVHFYSPSLGRINRFTFTRLTAAKRLREEMDRYTGPRGHLETLETLRITPGAVSPLVRFSLMAGFLRALTHLEEYLAEGDDANRAYLQRLVESDPRRVSELRDFFSLVDRNGDGRIDASELTAVAAAVGGMGGDEGGGGGGDSVDDFYVTLLEHARASFAGEAEEGEAEGEAGEAEAGSGSLDFATFVRLMSSKAVSEYKVPEAELRPAFAALDVNGDGVISRDEMLCAMECVGRNLPAGGSRDEESLARKAAVAFDALDVDKSGTLDYEEFVAVLSGLRHTDPLEALSE